MRLVPYFLGLSFAIAALGCSSSTTDTTAIARPELVAVSPDDFLGQYSCIESPDASDASDASSPLPGQVQSYVATLYDTNVGANDAGADGSLADLGFQLPSSPATSCLFPVTFADVITGHRYLAQIDAYDRAPEALAPQAPGSLVQVDSTGKPVPPLWTTQCGDYPPTFVDGGSYGSYGGSSGSNGAAAVRPTSAGEAGAGGEAGVGGEAGIGGARDQTDAGVRTTGDDQQGLLTYEGLTRTAHDCKPPPPLIAK